MPGSNTRKPAKGRDPVPPRAASSAQPRSRRWQIDIANRQPQPIPRRWIHRAVENTLASSKFSTAEISIAVVGDAEMQRLNRSYLQHDYPTDVLSFPLHRDVRSGQLAGEIIVSLPTARRTARTLGWAPRWELLLYVVHGTLHLVGHDDKTRAAQHRMRAAEAAVFRALQLPPPPSGESEETE